MPKKFNTGLVLTPDPEIVIVNEMFTEIQAEFQGDVVEISGTELQAGKPIEIVASGKFQPGNMGGRSITLKQEDLQEYVDNTNAALESTKLEFLIPFPP